MSKIKRSKRNTPFVLINKESLQDKSISWQAKGLLAYLLSLPDDWQILVADLANRSKNGRDSTAAILNELIGAGYIERQRIKDENNRFCGYDYTVFDSPQTESPKTAFPFTDSPKTGNTELLSNNKTKQPKTKRIGTPPHKTDLDQLEDKKIETLKPYEVDIQNYHFNNWTESLKEAFLNFCSDQYDKNKKFSGTRAKEIIRQIEIDIAISGAVETENAVRFCLAAGWHYKFSYYQNSNESKKSQKTEQPPNLEAYLLQNYREKDVIHFKEKGDFEKWETVLNENLFKLTNIAKGYKNENLSPLFFFEIMFMPFALHLNGSKPERKLESFEKIFSQQTDYNKEKGDFRKIIKAVYEKTKA